MRLSATISNFRRQITYGSGKESDDLKNRVIGSSGDRVIG